MSTLSTGRLAIDPDALEARFLDSLSHNGLSFEAANIDSVLANANSDFTFIPSVSNFADLLSASSKSKSANFPKIIHPIALMNQKLSLDFSNQYIVTGCNRSGTTLLFRAITSVLGYEVPKSLGACEQLIQSFANHYFTTLNDKLATICADVGASFSKFGVTKFGTIDYHCAGEGTFGFLGAVSCKRYFFDRVHKCYPINLNTLLPEIERLKLNHFVSIRNPLDILVSNAFEYEYIFYTVFADEVADCHDDELRREYGKALLNDYNWFEMLAIYVQECIAASLNAPLKPFFIKYESLVDSPEKTIKNISQLMNVPLSTVQIKKIWDEIGFKPLVKYKSHMFMPEKREKWKYFLNKRHIDILIKLGYENLMTALGYLSLNEAKKCLQMPCSDNAMKNSQISKMTDIRKSILGAQFDFSEDCVKDRFIFKNYDKQDQITRLVTNDDFIYSKLDGQLMDERSELNILLSSSVY